MEEVSLTPSASQRGPCEMHKENEGETRPATAATENLCHTAAALWTVCTNPGLTRRAVLHTEH